MIVDMNAEPSGAKDAAVEAAITSWRCHVVGPSCLRHCEAEYVTAAAISLVETGRAASRSIESGHAFGRPAGRKRYEQVI